MSYSNLDDVALIETQRSWDAKQVSSRSRTLQPLEQLGKWILPAPQWRCDEQCSGSLTRWAFTRDGWFRAGDMGFMDERGYFTITDRKKDMIVVSGFKVFPNEIEDVVMMHAGVLEAAAVGVTDPKSGKAVKLFVVRKDPNLIEQALLEHCRKNLTGYKVPKIIEFRDEPLPKSAVGKILRRQLREPMTQRIAPWLISEHPKNDDRVKADSQASEV